MVQPKRHYLQVSNLSLDVFRLLFHVWRLYLLMMPFICCVIVLPSPNSFIFCALLHPGGFSSGLLEKFGELICTSLQTVTNINISSSTWAQCILPAAKEGLEICSTIDLSLPSYLSSLHSTSELASSILTPSDLTFESSLLHEALVRWSAVYPMPPENHRHF